MAVFRMMCRHQGDIKSPSWHGNQSCPFSGSSRTTPNNTHTVNIEINLIVNDKIVHRTPIRSSVDCKINNTIFGILLYILSFTSSRVYFCCTYSCIYMYMNIISKMCNEYREITRYKPEWGWWASLGSRTTSWWSAESRIEWEGGACDGGPLCCDWLCVVPGGDLLALLAAAAAACSACKLIDNQITQLNSMAEAVCTTYNIKSLYTTRFHIITQSSLSEKLNTVNKFT